MRLALERLAVVGVRDRDQPPRPLGQRGAAQARDAVLGHDVVDGVLERGHDRALRQPRADPAAALARGRVQHDERLPALRVHRAAREVGLAAAGGPVAAGDRLRRALAVEVDLGRGVDRDEVVLARDPARVVDEVDRQQLDRAVVVQPVVEPLGAEAERRLDLVAAQLLAHAGRHAGLDEVDDPVGEQLGVDAEVAVAAEPLQHRVRDAADADLQRRAVGDPLDDRGGDRAVALVGRGGRDLDERPVGLAVAEQLGGVDLVEPERARHPLVDLEEERHLADQRRDVVGVRAEREVAGAVGRARRRQHDRVPGRELQQPRHLREVVRDELAAALPVRLARRAREEVGDVPQPVAEGPVDVRPLVQRVHLVHAHAAQALVLALEHVEQPDRLPVGQREDHVRARARCARGRPRAGRRRAALSACRQDCASRRRARRHAAASEMPCTMDRDGRLRDREPAGDRRRRRGPRRGAGGPLRPQARSARATSASATGATRRTCARRARPQPPRAGGGLRRRGRLRPGAARRRDPRPPQWDVVRVAPRSCAPSRRARTGSS